MSFPRVVLIICLTLIVASDCCLALDIYIQPLGDGRYSVNGTQLDGVAAMELNIRYNSSIISAPTVNSGSLITGAVMAANTNQNGSITAAILRTSPVLSGSGQILGLNFAGHSAPDGITEISAKVLDINGRQINTKTYIMLEPSSSGSGFITTPGVPFRDIPATQGSTTSQTGSATTTTTTTGMTPSIGGITMPADLMQQEPQKKQEAQAPPPVPAPAQEQYRPSPQPEEPRQTTKPKQSEELKPIRYPSVIERFKSYSGDRNPQILAALFARKLDDNISQEPQIALSDGSSTLRIKLLLELKDGDSAPNFATSAAKITSLERDDANGQWIIELLPAKESVEASLSILAGSRVIDLPLVVLPPAKGLTFSPEEQTAFAKDSGAKPPRFDLNGDGRHDYIDDYMYAGNLLLMRNKPGGGK